MANPAPLRLPAPAAGAPLTEGGELYFIGNATTLITCGGFTILTDPAFLHKGEYAPIGYGMHTRREVEPACAIGDLPALDLVILSHYHGDHFDEVAARELRKDIPIITTHDAAKHLSGLGFVNLYPLDTWEAQVAMKGEAELTVTAMPAQHAPDLVNPLMPKVMGSLLEFRQHAGAAPLYRLYITGDTILYDRLNEIPRRYPAIDLGLIHIGGTTIMGMMVTMSGEQGVRAAQIIQPRVAIPVHYNDFSVFTSGLDDFRVAAESVGLAASVRYLRHGDRYPFEMGAGDAPTVSAAPLRQ